MTAPCSGASLARPRCLRAGLRSHPTPSPVTETGFRETPARGDGVSWVVDMQNLTSLDALLTERAWLRRVAGALVREPAAADDLVQETYLRALERGSAGVRKPKAWLASVVRNLASNRARSDRRRAARERAVERESPRAPDALLARAELIETVGRSVLMLAEPYRTTVLLRYFESQSPPAIATQMDVPLETVRTRLKKALRILRARLDVEAGGERRGWMAALLPWAGIAGPSTATSATTLMGGMVAMSTGKKLAAVALLLLLGVWGVTQSGLLRSDGEVPTPLESGFTQDTPANPELAVRPSTPEATQPPPTTETQPTSEAATPAPLAGATLTIIASQGTRPIAEAAVRIIPYEPTKDASGDVERKAATDEDGIAEFSGLANGVYVIFVRFDERTRWRGRVPILGGRGGRVPVRLPTDTVVLNGVVRSESALGKGVEGAEVKIHTGQRSPMERFETTVHTDRGGRYEVALPRGHAKGFFVTADGYAPWPARAAYRELSLSLRGLERGVDVTRDVVLTRGATLRGRVHTKGGTPIPGWKISIGKDMGRGVTVVTDAEGRYEATGLNGGEFRVTPSLRPWFPLTWPLEKVAVANGEVREWDLEMRKGRRLNGVVQDADGAPVAGAQVYVVTNGMARRTGPQPMLTESDEKGRWTIDPVEPWLEVIRVRAEKSEAGAGTASVAVRDDAVASLTLTLRRDTAVIHGAVTDRNAGTPIPQARVLLLPLELDGRLSRFAVSDENGAFRFEGLLPGTWKITAHLRGYFALPDAHVVVSGGKAHEVGLRLDQGRVFSGVVVHADGRPAPHAQVFVVTQHPAAEKPQTMRTVTDRQGRFRINRVPSGKHRVEASYGSSLVSEGVELLRGAKDLRLELKPR